MAAISSKGRVLAGSVGKRIWSPIWAGSSRDTTPFPSFPASASRRGVHVSWYDKNVDDHVHQKVVPDDVIQPQSNKYWSPHPKTGVFGPAADHKGATESGADHAPTSPGNGSVLDQTVWFRPLEDLDKTPYA